MNSKKLRILVVNDDGIASEGLLRLAEAACALGDVWVAAPARQCSGMSQRITIFDELPVEPRPFPIPVRGAWAVDGTPADCVKAAFNFLLPEPPELVLSGINNGFNAGFDIAYSGTVGAAMEGLMKGAAAIAFSNAWGGLWDTAEEYLPGLLAELAAAPLPRGRMWNVNFPGCARSDCRGVLRGRAIAPCQLYQDIYTREDRSRGGFVLRNATRPLDPALAAPGSDIAAVLGGYVSVGEIACRVLG